MTRMDMWVFTGFLPDTLPQKSKRLRYLDRLGEKLKPEPVEKYTLKITGVLLATGLSN